MVNAATLGQQMTTLSTNVTQLNTRMEAKIDTLTWRFLSFGPTRHCYSGFLEYRLLKYFR